MSAAGWSSADEVQDALGRQRYVADRGLAVTVFLALRLGKSLFLEGEAGVGKTEVGRDRPLTENRLLV